MYRRTNLCLLLVHHVVCWVSCTSHTTSPPRTPDDHDLFVFVAYRLQKLMRYNSAARNLRRHRLLMADATPPWPTLRIVRLSGTSIFPTWTFCDCMRTLPGTTIHRRLVLHRSASIHRRLVLSCPSSIEYACTLPDRKNPLRNTPLPIHLLNAKYCPRRQMLNAPMLNAKSNFLRASNVLRKCTPNTRVEKCTASSVSREQTKTTVEECQPLPLNTETICTLRDRTKYIDDLYSTTRSIHRLVTGPPHHRNWTTSMHRRFVLYHPEIVDASRADAHTMLPAHQYGRLQERVRQIHLDRILVRSLLYAGVHHNDEPTVRFIPTRGTNLMDADFCPLTRGRGPCERQMLESRRMNVNHVP